MHVAQSVSRLSTMRKRVGAAVIKSGRVVGVGCNREGVSKLSRSKYSRHAEVQAVIAAGDVRGGTLYVYRELNTLVRSEAMAKPCADCMEVMIRAGIKKVVYTTGNVPAVLRIKGGR